MGVSFCVSSSQSPCKLRDLYYICSNFKKCFIYLFCGLILFYFTFGAIRKLIHSNANLLKSESGAVLDCKSKKKGLGDMHFCSLADIWMNVSVSYKTVIISELHLLLCQTE